VVIKDAATLASINDKLRKDIQLLEKRMRGWRETGRDDHEYEEGREERTRKRADSRTGRSRVESRSRMIQTCEF
jgi:hypothetical protein